MTVGAQATGPDQLAWEFSFPAIESGELKLSDFRGRVLLVVNTASFCGYTPQYESLQELHSARAAEGLTVIGVPSRDFRQESADNATVKNFCDTMYGIDFPMSGIQHVRGDSAAPFYAWVRAGRGWQPAWNFNKVLIGRDGEVKATFGAGDTLGGAAITQAIAAELAAR
ncbi:MAG: glutathione peroxidase [Acetobacteraceae bacterium]|nr:glutathione peroxidase [Acetobacteraceae bacterium]